MKCALAPQQLEHKKLFTKVSKRLFLFFVSGGFCSGPQVSSKLCVVNTAPEAVIKTLRCLCNLRMGPICQSVYA